MPGAGGQPPNGSPPAAAGVAPWQGRLVIATELFLDAASVTVMA
ncbi:hypothetical protein CGMCC3_g5171 [Colletotrichum fructicola]|nr:uncharacterized protein CGMCC3_g5171 [Colletotrichum fructicola]KAE9578811.1 hypothetical protein CGMCC3_g5171 [Colletotrichum fructicola]